MKVVPTHSEVESNYTIKWAKVAYINAFTRPLHQGVKFKVCMDDFSFGEITKFYWGEYELEFILGIFGLIICCGLVVLKCIHKKTGWKKRTNNQAVVTVE